MAERIHDDILEVLISEKKIRARVRELGEQITKDYAGRSPVFVCILKGACVFFTDLIREVSLPLSITII